MSDIAGIKIVENPKMAPNELRMCNCNQGQLPCKCRPVTVHLADLDPAQRLELARGFGGARFDWGIVDGDALRSACRPTVIWDLIAELERVVDLNHKQFGMALQKNREIDQLKAENEALRKDAERYRWIRDKAGRSFCVRLNEEFRRGDSALDLAIDIELSKEAPNG
jgi:hypothetical protein